MHKTVGAALDFNNDNSSTADCKFVPSWWRGSTSPARWAPGHPLVSYSPPRPTAPFPWPPRACCRPAQT